MRSIVSGAEEKIKEQEGLLMLREKELDTLSVQKKLDLQRIR